MMDTAFAKIVVDGAGRNHILIDGEIISISAITPDQRNNQIVEEIVRALRSRGENADSITSQLIAAQARPGHAGKIT